MKIDVDINCALLKEQIEFLRQELDYQWLSNPDEVLAIGIFQLLTIILTEAEKRTD